MGLECFDQFNDHGMIEQLHLPMSEYDFLETLILDENEDTFDYFFNRLYRDPDNYLNNTKHLKKLFKHKNYLSFAQTHSKTLLLPKLQIMFDHASPDYASTPGQYERKMHLEVTSRAELIESNDYSTQRNYFDMYTEEKIISFLIEDEKGDGYNLLERIILSESNSLVEYFTNRLSFPRPISLAQQAMLKTLWKGKDYIDFIDTHAPLLWHSKNQLRLMQKRLYSRILHTPSSRIEISDSLFIHHSFEVVKEEYDKYLPDDFVSFLLQPVSFHQTFFARIIMKNSWQLINYVFERLIDPTITVVKQKELINKLLGEEDYVDLALANSKYRVLQTVADFYSAIGKLAPKTAKKIKLAFLNKKARSNYYRKPFLGPSAEFFKNSTIEECKAQYKDLSLKQIVSNLTHHGREYNIFELLMVKSNQLVQFIYDKFTENNDAIESIHLLKTLCENKDYIDFALTKERHAALPILIDIYELIGKTSPRLEEANAIFRKHSQKNDPIERPIQTETEKQDLSLPKPAILHSFKTTKEKVDVGFNKPVDNSANELFPELQQRDRLDFF